MDNSTSRRPDLQIGSLRIWIHGREYPDSSDFWDGNWLKVTAQCKSVVADGSILLLSQIDKLLHDCKTIHADLAGEAVLDDIEPNLKLRITSSARGRFDLRTEITPHLLTEGHWILDDVDQTDLGSFITQCEEVLRAYPVLSPRP